MNKFIKRIFGIDKIEAVKEDALAIAKEASLAAEEAIKRAEEAGKQARLTSMSPKDRATELGEPWIAVLDTHVNEENIRNGFFELDWNDQFVLELKKNGYIGDTDEEIVDQWFSELCRNVGADAGVDMSRRGTGYINVNNLGNGRTEVS
jgi:hypothetical protein